MIAFASQNRCGSFAIMAWRQLCKCNHPPLTSRRLRSAFVHPTCLTMDLELDTIVSWLLCAICMHQEQWARQTLLTMMQGRPWPKVEYSRPIPQGWYLLVSQRSELESFSLLCNRCESIYAYVPFILGTISSTLSWPHQQLALALLSRALRSPLVHSGSFRSTTLLVCLLVSYLFGPF